MRCDEIMAEGEREGEEKKASDGTAGLASPGEHMGPERRGNPHSPLRTKTVCVCTYTSVCVCVASACPCFLQYHPW